MIMEKKKKFKLMFILSFFGLVMKLGPIVEWGLNMEKKTISANPKILRQTKGEYLQWRYL